MAGKRVRRFWDDAEKLKIVAQARVPGVSVAQVARRYDVNANLIFNWLLDPRTTIASEKSHQLFRRRKRAMPRLRRMRSPQKFV